jgi:hypothetical protein
MARAPDTTRSRRHAVAAVVLAVLSAVGCQTTANLGPVSRSQLTEPLADLPAPPAEAADPLPAVELPAEPDPDPVFAVLLRLEDVPPTDEGPLPPLTLPPLPVGPPTEDKPAAPAPAVGPVQIGSRVIPPGEIGPLTGLPVAGGCSTCGGTGSGCNQCTPFPRTGFASRLVGAVYDVLCCTDPCYQPKWEPLADAAFFTDSFRPVSHTRLRWEYGHYAQFMDRAEYFWARSDGNGKGPRPVAAVGIPRTDYHEISQYTETAAGPGFSAFVSTPYRSVNPTFSDPPSAAGFGDITVGTKSVFFDTELLVLGFQFKTTLPVGQPRKGLGIGHVSLEPSLLLGLRTSPHSFIQGQVAEWIPIAGDPTYAGAVLHYHLAFNRTLWQPIPEVQLVGTMEFHGWSFQDGGFTDPDGGFRRASGTNLLQLGPGLRLFFCDKYDFGVGTNFGVTGKNNVGDTYRFEMRVRY